MKRFGRIFASMVAVTTLVPNVLMASVGDIHDISKKIQYTSNDSSVLKQNIKDKFADEENLYIENEDGKLVSYSEIKQAKRQAIVSVMTKHSIDINDSEAFSNALVSFENEIAELQEELIANLVAQTVSPVKVDVTSNMSDLGRIKYTANVSSSTDFTLEELSTFDGERIDYAVSVTAKQGDSVIFESEMSVGDTVTIPTASDFVMEVRKTKDNTHKISVNVGKRNGVWKFDYESSKATIGIIDNATSGYDIPYVLELNERSGTERRPYSGQVSLILKESETDRVIHEATLSDTVGTLTIPTIDAYRVDYEIQDVSTGEILMSGDVTTAQYTLGNKLTMEIDMSQKVERKKIVINSEVIDQNLEGYYLVVSQGDSIVSEEYVNIGSEMKLYTEGEYTFTAYHDDTKSVKLSELDCNFKWAIPNGVSVVSQIDDSMLPWNYSNNLNANISITHNGIVQSGEEFTIRITDNQTSQVVHEGNFTTEVAVSLPTAYCKTFNVELIKDEETIEEYLYINPLETQIDLLPLADRDTEAGEPVLRLYPTFKGNASDYSKLIKKVDVILGDGIEDFATIENITLHDGTSTVTISDEYAEAFRKSKYAIVMVHTIDGQKSSYGAQLFNVSSLKDHRDDDTVIAPPTEPETPELPFEPETPDLDMDFETEETSPLGDPFEEPVSDDESLEFELEEFLLPKSDEDEDSLLMDDIDEDDMDFDLPVLDFDEI